MCDNGIVTPHCYYDENGVTMKYKILTEGGLLD